MIFMRTLLGPTMRVRGPFQFESNTGDHAEQKSRGHFDSLHFDKADCDVSSSPTQTALTTRMMLLKREKYAIRCEIAFIPDF